MPNITDLKIKAESMYLVKKIPYDFVEDYFNKVKPLSAKTATKILISKVKKNNNVVDDKLKKEIIDVFYNYDFSNKEMDDFLDLFSDFQSSKYHPYRSGSAGLDLLSFHVFFHIDFP